MAYGDNRTEVVSDTFDSSISASWDNPPYNNAFSWVSGGVIEPSGSGLLCTMRYNAGSFNNDQYAQIDVNSYIFNQVAVIGALARMQTGTNEACYAGATKDTGSDNWRIYEYDSVGGVTTLADQARSFAPVNGDQFAIECEGSSIRFGMVAANGDAGDNQYLSAIDATLTSGRPGIINQPNLTSYSQITAFRAGNIPASSDPNIVDTHGFYITSGSGSDDFAVTLNGGGGNRAILVIVSGLRTGVLDITGVSFGATTATELYDNSIASSRTTTYIAVFNDAQHPGAGAQTLTVDATSGNLNMSVTVIELENVDQTIANWSTDITAVNASYVADTVLTTTLTGETNKAGIGFFTHSSNSFWVPDPTFSLNMSEDEEVLGGNNSRTMIAMDNVINATPLDFDVSASTSGGTLPTSYHYGVIIIPASGFVAPTNYDKFQATGGSTSLLPGTTWAAPNGLFPTTDRNDGSSFSWNSSTSTLTIPSSNLPDGYLFLWGYEIEDTSNGRCNPSGRMIQASGTGNFASASTMGYNRDTSEDRSYVAGWSFVDGPSAGATFQFQWERDVDAPTGGTVRSFIQAIPFYYSDIGIYTSTNTTATGGTTPVQIGGFSGTDGSNITISSNVVTMAGDNKRYLCLGSAYHQGVGNSRTQRWYGFRIDGTKDDAAKTCCYARQASDDRAGGSFMRLYETATTDRTLDIFQYRGDGVAAGQGGADVDGNTTGVNSSHAMVVIELNDEAEVFSSTDETGGQEFALTGPVDVNIARTSDIEFNDAASFTRVNDTQVNAEVAMDVLAFANISHAREAGSIGSGLRWTVHGEFTIGGVEQTDVGFHGNYNRGNQSTTDCHGSSTNQAGCFALTVGQDIGVSNQELAGSEGGNGDIESQPGWVGFGLINLGTTAPASGSGPQTIATNQITEQETLFSVTASPGAISGVTGLVTEQEQLFTVTPVQGGLSVVTGLAQEAETLTGVVPAPGGISSLTGLLSESETLFSASVSVGAQIISTGQVTEQEQLFSVTLSIGAVAVATGQINEQEQLFSVAVSLGSSVSVGQVTETETLFAASDSVGPVSIPISLIQEQESLFAAQVRQGLIGTPGQLVEQEQVFAVSVLAGGAFRLVGQVIEQEQLFSAAPGLAPAVTYNTIEDALVAKTGVPDVMGAWASLFGKLPDEHINDAEARWLISEGATPANIEDMWIELHGPGDINKVILDYLNTL